MNSNCLPSVLSTKKLSSSQKDLFDSSKLDLIDHDLIEIRVLDFSVPSTGINAIFTSKNAAKAVCNNQDFKNTVYRCFCVGEKTKSFLEKNGQKIIKMEKNGQELADFIVKKFRNDTFYYFSGTIRREELPTTLKSQKIAFFEVKTYQTDLKPRYFDQKFDKILFFSPSGVESFMMQNSIGESVAICIGKTTANAVKKYTKNVQVAESTSIESVIKAAVKMT